MSCWGTKPMHVHKVWMSINLHVLYPKSYCDTMCSMAWDIMLNQRWKKNTWVSVEYKNKDCCTHRPTILTYCCLYIRTQKGRYSAWIFPGVLQLSTDLKGKQPLLNKEYRDFGANRNPEFEYFVKYFLSEISPKRTHNTKKMVAAKKTCHRLSLLCTKQFLGLMMILDNKLHVWNHQISLKKHMSGNKPNWSG